MTFVIRHPAQEDMFMKFNASSGETLPVAAGTLVRIVDDRTVDVISDASAQTVFGWLMQKVKDEYSDVPSGYRMRGDFGSSDAFIGDPVGVAHGPGAVYEVDTYVDEGGDGIAAGTVLYSDDDGKLSDTDADSGTAVAIAMNTLTATECSDGEMLLIKSLI